MEKIKNPLLTTAEAAAYLGLKISYLHKLMMRHAIPYYKPMGKLCFFSQADLAYMQPNCIAEGNRAAGSTVSIYEAHREEMSLMPHILTRPPPLSGRTSLASNISEAASIERVLAP